MSSHVRAKLFEGIKQSFYSTLVPQNNNTSWPSVPEKLYKNAETDKAKIYSENKNKSGIYL